MGKKGRAVRRDITQTRASIFIPPKRKFKWDTLHSTLIMAVLIHVVFLTVFAIFRYEVKHKDAITEVYEVEMVPLPEAPGGGGGGGGGSDSEPALEEQAPIAYKAQSLEVPEAPQKYAPQQYAPQQPAPALPVPQVAFKPSKPAPQSGGGSPSGSEKGSESGGGHGSGVGTGNGSGTGPGSGTGTGGGTGSGVGTGTGSGTGPGSGSGADGGSGSGRGTSRDGLAQGNTYLAQNSQYFEAYRNGKLNFPVYKESTTGFGGPIIPQGQNSVEGNLTLRYRVNENGRVTNCSIEKSSEHAHEDQIIKEFVSGFIFYPATVDGQTVSVEVIQDFSYYWNNVMLKH
jgi:TonB family protein